MGLEEKKKQQKAEAQAIVAMLDTEGWKILEAKLQILHQHYADKMIATDDPQETQARKSDCRALRALFNTVQGFARIEEKIKK